MLIRRSRRLTPCAEAMYRIKRGLAGYVSYLAACEMNESFSEYILYEPTLRILTRQGFSVKCESPCPGFAKAGRGDFKKIDFVAEGLGENFALEMKWARTSKLKVSADVEKLEKYCAETIGAKGYLVIFGTKSVIDSITTPHESLKEQGAAVYADFGVTKYGCRSYLLRDA